MKEKKTKVWLTVKTQEFIQIISVHEILFCQGCSGYTKLCLTGNRIIVACGTLSMFEKELPQDQFFRIHQSYLVGISWVDKIHKDGYVILKNGTELPVSVRRRAAFISSFLS